MRHGPLSGLGGNAEQLMLHLGYQPRDYPQITLALEEAIGKELLDLGRQILAEHGLPVRDSTGIVSDTNGSR